MSVRALGSRLIPLVSLLAVACSESSGDPSTNAGAGNSATPQAGASSGGAGSDSTQTIGTFSVELITRTAETAGEAYSSISGKVYDAEVPSSLAWQVLERDEDCLLEKPITPYCEQPCVGGAACVEAGVCQPYPRLQDVGTVEVRGLGAGPFTLTPVGNAYQAAAGVRLPNPPCPIGSTFSLEASGAALPRFVLTGDCIAPLVLSGSEQAEVQLSSDAPMQLSWEAEAAGTTRVLTRLDVSHHGGLKGQVRCDSADDGDLRVSARLIAGLLQLGTAGYPLLTVRRVAQSHVSLAAGRIVLEVSSEEARALAIPGLVSCGTSADCPTGRVCQADRSCR